ncbi:MAG: single-stranded DNA-binding protein [Treponema sp.]|jgi:single-strand DNA-binding protein|nr:single-stranded DNA-binding protein [Treponema sp.]
MADINHVVLVGRLTRDAELKYTANGQAVCKFSLAVDRRKKNGDQWVEEVSFFDVVLWGKQGEAVNQYLLKGKQVGIEGELRQNRWEQDGQSRSKVEISATNLQLLGGGPGGSTPSYGQGSGGYQDRRGDAPPPPREAPAPRGGGDDGFADDIPF